MSERSLATVLAAAGISRVLWIDDKFDEEPDALTSVDAIELLGTLYAAKQPPRHAAVAALTVAMEFAEWESLATELLDNADPRVPDMLEDLRAQVRDLTGPVGAAGAAAEYTDDELDAILKSFGASIEKVGLKAWNQSRAELKGRITQDTLVIVDREFNVDGVSTKQGDEILKDLIGGVGGTVNIVMLTHSVPPEGADDLRALLARESGVPIHRFSVMAKGGDGPADVRLQRSVRIVMTHRTCFSLVHSIAEVMANGIEQARTELIDQSVYDLDLVLFEKSLDEGASETDVLTRLLLLRQRIEVDKHFANDHECFRAIAALRELRSLAELSDEQRASGRPASLLEWRQNEVFDPGDRINARHAPLSCGDVFQSDGQTNCYVLLGQPCDMSVRKDGKRKSEEAFLVLAKPVANDDERTLKTAMDAARVALDANDAAGALAQLQAATTLVDKRSKGAPTQRFFRIPALLGASEWQLDFNSCTSVNLLCLDLAVFNPDGALILKEDMSAPAPLLPGWKVRLERASALLRKANGAAPKGWVLTFGDQLPRRDPVLSKGQLRFQYKRIGRVRAPRAVAAYAALSSYQARAAFEHDFAEKLVKASSTSA